MTHLNQDFATGYEKIGLWTGLKREIDWKKKKIVKEKIRFCWNSGPK